MSKYRRPVLLFFGAAVIFLQGEFAASAQDLTATVRIRASEPSVAVVEGKFAPGRAPRSLYFLNEFGSSTGLERRISNVRITQQNGDPIPAAAVNGQYSSENIAGWSYRADISPANDRFASAHISRSDQRAALIVLDDILPQMPSDSRSARIIFELPAGWTIATSEKRVDGYVYTTEDIEKAVFFAGPALRSKSISRGRAELGIAITGDWLFTDDEAVRMAEAVFTDYERIFGGAPAAKMQIAIMPFPTSVPVGQWEAGSRGSSITIVSSDMPFKNQSVQRLHEQLRHEIFHLWIPNGIKLTGNYDWFYEGFALYASLKNGVATNRIRFDDMLDTVGRAYDIGGGEAGDSLIGLSKSRWTGSNTKIYARGLLLAFLCDIALLDGSRGKRSINDILKTVFKLYRSAAPEEANTAILAILRSYDVIKPLVDLYVLKEGVIDWGIYLHSAGLMLARDGRPTRLKAVLEPTRSQKQMLNDLGYNNWRKLSGGNR